MSVAILTQEHGAPAAELSHLSLVALTEFAPKAFGVGAGSVEEMPRLDDSDVHVVGPKMGMNHAVLPVLFVNNILRVEGDTVVHGLVNLSSMEESNKTLSGKRNPNVSAPFRNKTIINDNERAVATLSRCAA